MKVKVENVIFVHAKSKCSRAPLADSLTMIIKLVLCAASSAIAATQW